MTLALALAACGSDAGPASTTSTTAATSTPSGTETTAPVESTVASPASAEPTEQPAAFPIAAFAAIREDPVSAAGAAKFQATSLYAGAVGHGGEHIGNVTWAGRLPEEGSVVVALSNRAFENVLGMGIPLVEAVRSD